MERIVTIKCSDPYTNSELWNGKVLVDDGNIEGISNNIDITYISGHFLLDGITLSLIRNNCEDEIYNLGKIKSDDGIDYYDGTCTNVFNKQYKRMISFEEDNDLIEAKVIGLKKKINDYKKNIVVGI